MNEKEKISWKEQLRHPNFIGKKSGKLFLVRCYNCEPERGRENYGISVASGECAWCGWKDDNGVSDG